MIDMPARTALELPMDEWKRYNPHAALQQREAADRAALSLRRRRALRTARKAAKLLRDNFGAQRVILFGSLREKRTFTRWSDIDLAAWGIPPQRFYEAVAVITGLSAEFKIDLIDPQFSPPSLAAAIDQKGVEL